MVDKWRLKRYNSFCQFDSDMSKGYAEVAELADAQASGACGSNIVWVQVPSSALKIPSNYAWDFFRGHLKSQAP